MCSDCNVRHNFIEKMVRSFGEKGEKEGLTFLQHFRKTFKNIADFTDSSFIPTFEYVFEEVGRSGHLCKSYDYIEFFIIFLFSYFIYFTDLAWVRCLKKDYGLGRDHLGKYALLYACENGHISVVKFLKENFNLLKGDVRYDSNYALRMSGKNGHIRVLKYLKEQFGLTKADARTGNGFLLQNSIEEKNRAIVKYLIEDFELTKHSCTNYIADVFHTFLFKNRDFPYIKFLRKLLGLTKKDVTKFVNNLFEYGFIHGHLEAVRLLHKEFGFTREEIRANYNWALRVSCKYGHLPIVKYLKKEFKLTKEDFQDRFTPTSYWDRSTMLAAMTNSFMNGHVPVVKFLLHDVGLTKEDFQRNINAALRKNAENGNCAMIEFLWENAWVTKNDIQWDNNFVLRISCEQGNVNVVKYLKNGVGLTKADAQIQDNYALRYSYRNGHIEVLKCLKKEFGFTKEDARRVYVANIGSYGNNFKHFELLNSVFMFELEDIRAEDNYLLRQCCRIEGLKLLKYLKEKFGLTKEDFCGNNNQLFKTAFASGSERVITNVKEEFGLKKEDLLGFINDLFINTPWERTNIIKFMIREFDLKKEELQPFFTHAGKQELIYENHYFLYYLKDEFGIELQEKGYYSRNGGFYKQFRNDSYYDSYYNYRSNYY